MALSGLDELLGEMSEEEDDDETLRLDRTDTEGKRSRR